MELMALKVKLGQKVTLEHRELRAIKAKREIPQIQLLCRFLLIYSVVAILPRKMILILEIPAAQSKVRKMDWLQPQMH